MTGSDPLQGGPRVVRVGGLSVRVHLQGEGEPLLLLNGVTRPLESWVPLAEELPGRTLVTVSYTHLTLPTILRV